MMDQGKTIDLIFFDFTKAFDTVCHTVLISKLRCFGIDNELVDWIEYFLCNRICKLEYLGSVLGPILFLIHINFLMNRPTSKFKVFGDDIKIYSPFNTSDDDSIRISQNNIDILVNTSSSRVYV